MRVIETGRASTSDCGPMPVLAPLSDADIRPVLKGWLRATIAEDDDTVILEELGLCRGQVRLDLAVVNGILHGFEIKSDRDSLIRLAGQADVYSKVLDWATLVVGSRHLVDAMLIVPSWWGVLRVDAGPRGPVIEEFRTGRPNPARDSRALAELLWLQEALVLLEQRGQAVGVRGRPRRLIWDRLCERLETEEIAAAVRTRLKARARTPDPRPCV